MGGKSAAAKYSQMKWHIDNREDWGKDDWKDDQNNSGWDGGKNAGWQAGGTVVDNGKCRAHGHIRAAVEGKSAAVKYSQMQWPKDKPEGWGKYDREHDENNSGRGDRKHGGWQADSTGGGNCNGGVLGGTVAEYAVAVAKREMDPQPVYTLRNCRGALAARCWKTSSRIMAMSPTCIS